METITSSKGISRRELLKRCMVVGAGLAVGTGFVAGSTAAWAMETKHVTPEEMATLIRMARDVYPHNHIPDEYYARAMKGYDSADSKSSVSEEVQALNKLAQEKVIPIIFLPAGSMTELRCSKVLKIALFSDCSRKPNHWAI